LRHQVVQIPLIPWRVIEHRLHRLICPCCFTSICVPLAAAVESIHSGRWVCSLVGLLGSSFPLRFCKTQMLLD